MSITAIGGTVKEGESFAIFIAAGGLTGATAVTIDGVACTSVVITDDFNATATAPVDGLLHDVTHGMNIV